MRLKDCLDKQANRRTQALLLDRFYIVTFRFFLANPDCPTRVVCSKIALLPIASMKKSSKAIIPSFEEMQRGKDKTAKKNEGTTTNRPSRGRPARLSHIHRSKCPRSMNKCIEKDGGKKSSPSFFGQSRGHVL